MNSILSLLCVFLFFLTINQAHPMAFSLLLLLISLLISTQLALNVSIWMGLGLALIFMGGMMIIILYVSALVSETKFFSSMPFFWLAPLLCLLLESTLPAQIISQVQTPLFSFYLSFSIFVLVFLTLYLLLTLILAVIISEAHCGPVTQWN